jgi:Holliday junction resolvasome RuvABC DNA-binding subunit
MLTLTHLSDPELLAHLPGIRAREQQATAEVIACLAEIDRRRLYLSQACSSLHTFCLLRLGYSENEAQKRIQVARLYQRLPRVLSELESGGIHLTGLFLLASYLTEQNADALLAEARGRTRREIEAILVRWFPRSDVLPSITPLSSSEDGVTSVTPAIPGNGTSSTAAAPLTDGPRIEPLSAASYRVEFTASAGLYAKLERARNLLSHAVPNGDLARLFERALDTLLEQETKRRLGAGRSRRRQTTPGSRHVPVDIARAVWERDAFQCTFVDAAGCRCAERRYLTIEHRQPFARGGPASVDNLCLLCKAHNAHRAREEFGATQIEAKRLEAAAYDTTLKALVSLGFERRPAKAALDVLRQRGEKPEVEPLLRAALALL